MNRFAAFEPALAVVSDGPEILTATGQAQEHFHQFDVDEYYDRIRTEADKKVSEVMESPGGKLYVDVPPLTRGEEHFFQYFVDASVKSFFLGTLVEHERNTPMMLGQIGAAAGPAIYQNLHGSSANAPGESVTDLPAVGLTLIGVVEPHPQAELHATVTGTVVWIARQPTPGWASGLAFQPALLTLGGGLGEAARFAAQARILMEQAPRIDIGSTVRGGEPLVEIMAPGLWVGSAAREARVRELRTDGEQAALALAVRFRQAEARKQQAAAGPRKAEAEYRHAWKLLQRITELARRQVFTAEQVDVHQLGLDAAVAAQASARAKLGAAEADLEVGLDPTGQFASRDAAIRKAVRDLERAQWWAVATRLRAPFDGVVTARTVERGEFGHGSPAAPSPALVTVTRLERVVFVAHVPAADVPVVRVGDVATVAIEGHPCCLLCGRISRVGQVVEAPPRGLRVEIDRENPGERVKPGMHGTATSPRKAPT